MILAQSTLCIKIRDNVEYTDKELDEFLEKFDDLSYDIETLARQLGEEYFNSKDFKVIFDYVSPTAFRGTTREYSK
jgi:hypothetical protein